MKESVIECISALVVDPHNAFLEKDVAATKVWHSTHNECICGSVLPTKISVMLRARMKAFQEVADKYCLSRQLQDIEDETLSSYCTCYGKMQPLLKDCNCVMETEWAYVKICLKLLLLLYRVISVGSTVEKPTTSESSASLDDPSRISFGVRDQKMIKVLLEMVIAFGFLPNFCLGVGVPGEKRLKHVDGCSLLPEWKGHVRKLYVCAKSIIIISQNPDLSLLVYSSMLGDLLAALIQLCYEPINKVKNMCSCCVATGLLANQDSALNEKPTFNFCLCCGSLCVHELKVCRNDLTMLTSKLYQPLLVRELLCIQGVHCSTRKKSSSQVVVPKWFIRKCGQWLSKCIMQKNGVSYVIQGILQASDIENLSWEQCETIGKLISHTPFQAASVEKYYDILCPQVILLLANGLSDSAVNVSAATLKMILSACVRSMLSQQYTLTRKLLLRPLLKPWLYTFEPFDPSACIKERELAACVNSLHVLLMARASADALLKDVLLEVIHPLFKLFCFLQHSVSGLKTPVFEMLSWYLRYEDAKPAVEVLQQLCFDRHPSGEGVCVKFMLENWFYQFGDTGGAVICFSRSADDVPADSIIGAEAIVDAVLSLLKDESVSFLRGEFFLSLLYATKAIFEKESARISQAASSDSEEDQAAIDAVVADLRYKITLSSVLAAVLDRYGDSVLQSTLQIVAFLKAMLEKSVSPEDPSFDDASLADFSSESKELCLMLLSSLLGTGRLSYDDFTAMQDLLPCLKQIADSDASPGCRSQADDIRLFIATHGAYSPAATNSGNGVTQDRPDPLSKASFEEAMRNVGDSLLPTRGHGLLQLSNLLSARNKFALEEKEKLLTIFEEAMSSDDSYLYLAAILGVVSLSDVCPDKVMPLLCKKFAMFPDDHQASSKPSGSQRRYSAEMRMKLCESIVKACHRLGDLLAKYAPVVFAALFTGVKDEEMYVRASGLSAIGDVCQLLKFAVRPYFQEIFSCVTHCVMSDDAAEVRRAGTQVFTLLFKGAGPDLVQIVGDSIKDVYRFVKLVAETDRDEVTRAHAQRALGELDAVMRGSLFGKPKLEKRIQVLSSST